MMNEQPKKKSTKTTRNINQKPMPLAIMIAVGKPKVRPMPARGERTAKNMMKKTGRGK